MPDNPANSVHGYDIQAELAEKDLLINRLQKQNEALKGLLKQEISHKESIARALRYHLQKNEEMINAVPWIVLLISQNFTYSDVNRFYASFYGLTPQDFTDKKIGEFNEDASLVSTIHNFLYADESQTASREIQFCNQGEDKHLLVILFRNKLGGHVSVIGIDITDRVKAERELIATKERLEKTSEELKEAIVEANQLAKEAQDANRAKSAFLSTMSHELRTPMNGIIGMANLIADTDLNDEQQEYADIILTSADNLLVIINDILDLSKIEAGKIELERITVEPGVLLKELEKLFVFQARSKNLAFSSVIESGLERRFTGDPGRLKQILINLINNALKFTQQGEIAVKGSLVDESETHVYIRFSVRDTGIGIHEKAIDKLFQSFTQADSSTTRKYGGTGLGLAICKQLVELMGGQIGVESRPDEGSTFFFTVLLEK